MDTNVKKFKFSLPGKILCIVICFATLITATGLGAVCAATLAYCDNGEVKSFTDSFPFRNKFFGDLLGMLNEASSDTIIKDYNNAMEKQRKTTVGDVYSRFEADYDDIFSKLSDEEILDNSYEDYIYERAFENEYGAFNFSLDAQEIFSQISNYRDKTAIRKLINSKYSAFITDRQTDAVSYYIGNFGYRYFVTEKSLKYSVKYQNNIVSNVDLTEKDVYNHDIYFVYKDGKLNSKGLPEELIEELGNYITSSKYYKKTFVLVCFEFPEQTAKKVNYLNLHNIIEYADHYDKYYGLMEFEPIALSCQNNFVLYAAFAVLMLIASFAAAFGYFTTAGRRDEHSPAKLAFIDYIPFEIHLGIASALGTGATFFLGQIIDGVDLSIPLLAAILIYAAVIWFLVFEFCASVARYAKSEKKFYNTFLLFHLFKILFIVAKKLFELDKRILRNMKISAKKTFGALTYAPKKFKRNIILLSVLYVFCNLIAAFLLALLYSWAVDYYEFFPSMLAFVGTIADLGANIALFIKVLRYIKQLDMIIDAASRHEDIAMDIDTLPQSLKSLALSMQSTNAQLQNAVAKAVKDERLKTELITNVSHDLKTPLTSIITYVDLLSKCDIQDEKAQEYIRVLESRGAKLKRLIEDLIEASKVTSGNITINPSRLNLYELCLQATVDTQPDFEKEGLELIVKENNNPPTIFADGSKSFRIVENLLSNARKYSAKGSRVYVNVYEEYGMGVFEIKNISAQPLDISPEELTERFVRGDKSRNLEGNGLGLSIAKELCKAQNGDLELIIDGDLFKAKAKLPVIKENNK